ncbi:hypothetical protein, variant, partial [Aphanomyces astaci]
MEDEPTAPLEHMQAPQQQEGPSTTSKRTLEDAIDEDEDDDDDDFDDIKVVKKPRVDEGDAVPTGDTPPAHDNTVAASNVFEGNDMDGTHPQGEVELAHGVEFEAAAQGEVGPVNDDAGQVSPTEPAFEAVVPHDDAAPPSTEFSREDDVVDDTSTDHDPLAIVPESTTTASDMDPFEPVTSDSDNHHEDEPHHGETTTTASSTGSAGDAFGPSVVGGTSPSVSSAEAIDAWSTTASEGADGPPSLLLLDDTDEGHPDVKAPDSDQILPVATLLAQGQGDGPLNAVDAVDLRPAAAGQPDDDVSKTLQVDNQSIREHNDVSIDHAVLPAPQSQQLAHCSTTSTTENPTAAATSLHALVYKQAEAITDSKHNRSSSNASDPTPSTNTTSVDGRPSKAVATTVEETPVGAITLSKGTTFDSSSSSSRWSVRPSSSDGTTAAQSKRPTADGSVGGGLSDVVWTRLLDFEHTPSAEFTLSQLHPSTLDIIATFPEFGQLAIVSRFTRAAAAPSVARNKDALLLQILQEYEQEQPAVRQLAVLSAVESAQEGHFAYGYAPPQPSTGMVANPPRRAYNLVAELQQHKAKFLLDEFGRVKTTAAATSTNRVSVPHVRSSGSHTPTYPDGRNQPSYHVGGGPARGGGRSRSPVRRPPQDRSRSRSRDRRRPFAPHQPPPHHDDVRYQERYQAHQLAPPMTSPYQQQQAPYQQQQQRYPPPHQQQPHSTYQPHHQEAPRGQSHAPPSQHEPYSRQPPTSSSTSYQQPPSRQSYQQQTPASSYQPSPEHRQYHHHQQQEQQQPRQYQQHQTYSGYQGERDHPPRQYPPPHHHHQQQHHQQAGTSPSQGGGSRPFGSSATQYLVDEFRRSEVYHRLAPSIRDALQALYAKGHVRELLNDSVLSRLVKLPEHLAVRAVENLGNTDASHVDNIHGFFVGIISRVYERDRGPPPAASGMMQPPLGDDRYSDYSSSAPRLRESMPPPQNHSRGQQQWSQSPVHDQLIRGLSPQVQAQLQHMAATGVMTAVDEWGEKCYEILAQLSESLAIEVLKRFTMANLDTVRNRSGFLIGVVKRCRQEYGLQP